MNTTKVIGTDNQDVLASQGRPSGEPDAATMLNLVRVAASKYGRCCDQYQDSMGGFCCHECGQRTMAMLKEVQTLLGIRKDGEPVDCAVETWTAHNRAIRLAGMESANNNMREALRNLLGQLVQGAEFYGITVDSPSAKAAIRDAESALALAGAK